MPRDALETLLRERMEGEVRFDDVSRCLYATDASLYQIMPLGVVFPRHAGDVQAAVRTAAELGVPVLPRGAGTSLGGQTVGEAVVLDFSRHMRRLVSLDVEGRSAEVEPGIVLDELNRLLQPHGLQFAPDVATSSRATLGGMMGNNSCGARSIRYGKTVDHVLAQEVVLSDGSAARFTELTPEEWRRCGEAGGVEGRIYAETQRICATYAAQIEAAFPRIMRRVGGYNLDEFTRRGHRNLAKLLVGSEGTLATVTGATLNLEPLPRHRGLLVSHFADLLEAMAIVPEILRHDPAAVELLDRILLDLTRGNSELAADRSFLVGEPEAVLMTEVTGESPAEVQDRLETLRAALTAAGAGYSHACLATPEAFAPVWRVRKAGVGLLMGMKGEAKPVGFIEDTAVPVERLAGYVRELKALLAEYDLGRACFYGHASVGCLHVRPVFSLKDPSRRALLREISGRVVDLVLRYGGAMSAEHGDGLVRSEWQERVFGREVYRAFREVKRAFDPAGIMNPGKIVDAPPLDRSLRFGPDYRPVQVLTTLDFSADGGFAGAVELCSGVGACRKHVEGAMCPSYRATLDEEHSTRGRANMLRLILSGQAGAPNLADPRLMRVMDLCLECKACKSECPSNVDMARLKSECLSHHRERHGASLRSHLLARPDLLGRLASPAAPAANRLLASGTVRALLDRVGLDRRRPLPPFARRTFLSWWRARRPAAGAGERGTVLLLADTFTNFHEPEVGIAAVRVLEALGWRVVVPPTRCCGRPLISKGFLRQARVRAASNVAVLASPTHAGLPVVGLEPSCLLTYRDEYAAFGLGPDAAEVTRRSRLLEEFLAEEGLGRREAPFGSGERDVLLHLHCHQRALARPGTAAAALGLAPGLRVREAAAGCCGMAGTFGYEREHYDVSLRIGELGPLDSVRRAPPEAVIVASGTSCRQQIAHATGRRALHAAEALAACLPPDVSGGPGPAPPGSR